MGHLSLLYHPLAGRVHVALRRYVCGGGGQQEEVQGCVLGALWRYFFDNEGSEGSGSCEDVVGDFGEGHA